MTKTDSTAAIPPGGGTPDAGLAPPQAPRPRFYCGVCGDPATVMVLPRIIGSAPMVARCDAHHEQRSEVAA